MNALVYQQEKEQWLLFTNAFKHIKALQGTTYGMAVAQSHPKSIGARV